MNKKFPKQNKKKIIKYVNYSNKGIELRCSKEYIFSLKVEDWFDIFLDYFSQLNKDFYYNCDFEKNLEKVILDGKEFKFSINPPKGILSFTYPKEGSREIIKSFINEILRNY